MVPGPLSELPDDGTDALGNVCEACLEPGLVPVEGVTDLQGRLGSETTQEERLRASLRETLAHDVQLSDVHDEDDVARRHRLRRDRGGRVVPQVDAVPGGDSNGRRGGRRPGPGRQAAGADRHWAVIPWRLTERLPEQARRERAADDVAVADDQYPSRRAQARDQDVRITSDPLDSSSFEEAEGGVAELARAPRQQPPPPSGRADVLEALNETEQGPMSRGFDFFGAPGTRVADDGAI